MFPCLDFAFPGSCSLIESEKGLIFVFFELMLVLEVVVVVHYLCFSRNWIIGRWAVKNLGLFFFFLWNSFVS